MRNARGMERAVLLVLILLGVWPDVSMAGELSPHEIYARTAPAVVMVMGYSNSHQRGSGGTGSIIRQDGLILTSAHVVIEEKTGKPYPRLTVYLKPDHVTGDPKVDLSREGRARVVAFSQSLDLALLKLDGLSGPFSVLEFDDSDRTGIGDRVVAIGHPEQGGLWSLTTGTISAEFENFNATKGKSVFQTETGLNRGNSGGPLLDTDGRMVGVNTAIARVAEDGLPITSISFSLKSNVAKRWLDEKGVPTQEVRASSDTPARDKPGNQSPALPSETTSQAASPSAAPRGAPPSGSSQPATQILTSRRPYNLDRLIRERSRAESDLEDMIKEMRDKFGNR